MIDLVPLRHFSQRIAEGWTMVAGYPLKPGDWCVTMRSPCHEEPSNLKKAGAERNKVRANRKSLVSA